MIQILGQAARRRVPRGGIGRHCFQADRLECRGDMEISLSGTGEISLLNLLQQVSLLGNKIERGCPGEHCVERRSQAVNVAGRAELIEPSGGLFGAHVGRSADR